MKSFICGFDDDNDHAIFNIVDSTIGNMHYHFFLFHNRNRAYEIRHSTV